MRKLYSFLNFSHRKEETNERRMGAENPTLKVSHGGNLHRHGPGEMVHVEVQIRELGQLPNLPRYGPLDAVVVEVQPLEPPEPGDRGREGAGEPTALQ